MRVTKIWGIIIGLMLCLIIILTIQKKDIVFHYRTLTNKEALEMIEREQVIILDVRTKLEYDSGHIKGAINVPLESIDEQFTTLFTDKNAYYMVYCRSGSRSEEASKKLAILGYQNVYDYGSLNSWQQELVKD